MNTGVDLSRFQAAIRQMSELPRKYGAQVLNANVLKVAVGAKGTLGLVQITQKATESKIRRDLMNDNLALKLAAKAALSKGIKRPTGPRSGASWSEWRRQVGDIAKRIVAARIASRAYIAAGWLFAARALARNVEGQTLTRLSGGKHLPMKEGGSAADSFARPATSTLMRAGIYNTSRGAGAVCPDSVIQIAVNNATADMRKYLEAKFGAAIQDAVQGSNTARSIAA